MNRVKIIIVILIIAAAAGVYLNRSYAYIYSKFNLTQAPAERTYMTGEKNGTITYAALGDSLTAGVGASNVGSTLPALIAEKLAAADNIRVTVKNLGVPGAKSADVLAGQVPQVAQLQPEIITLFIGTNDLHNFVSQQEFKNNLTTAIKALQQGAQAKIYLINVPYLGAADLVLPPYNWYFELELQQYNATIAQVAKDTGVNLIDLYNPSKKQFKDDAALYSADEFHPSDKGYALWADIIYDGIAK